MLTHTKRYRSAYLHKVKQCGHCGKKAAHTPEGNKMSGVMFYAETI